mgnify:CR=1
MMPYTLALIYKISASECARCEETKPLSASEKVLDAKNDDEGVLEDDALYACANI